MSLSAVRTSRNALIFAGSAPELVPGNIVMHDGVIAAHFHAHAVGLDGFEVENGVRSMELGNLLGSCGAVG